MRRFFTKIQKYIICKNLCVYCLTNIHSLVFLCKNFLWRSPSHLDNLCINKIIYKGSKSPAKMIFWQTSSSSICCKPVIIYHFAAINNQGRRNRWSRWSNCFTGIQSFTTEKFLASWMYERGNFSCFTGKTLVPPPLPKLIMICPHQNASY